MQTAVAERRLSSAVNANTSTAIFEMASALMRSVSASGGTFYLCEVRLEPQSNNAIGNRRARGHHRPPRGVLRRDDGRVVGPELVSGRKLGIRVQLRAQCRLGEWRLRLDGRLLVGAGRKLVE